MVKDALYKATRIKKLAAQIREEAAFGHANNCQCPVCQATFFVQRSMVFLEGALQAKVELKK